MIHILYSPLLYSPSPCPPPPFVLPVRRSNIANNYLTGPINWDFKSPGIAKRDAEVNVRSNYFYGTPVFRSNGKTFCPTTYNGLNPSGVPQLFLSSTKFNCFKLPADYYCPNLIEYQRTNQTCNTFCGASSAKGTCGGKGLCLWRKGMWQCFCRKGSRPTKNKLSCV